MSSLAKSFTVKANSLPVANFACDTSKPQKITCASSSTDADPGDSIQNYSWKFGTASAFSTLTPNTDYDFKTGGTFDVTLAVTDSYGGVGSVTKSITVKNNTAPLASFICKNTGLRTIHCASTSTDSDGSIASTSWALDDGANLAGTNFDHTFNDDQSHAITLTVTDDLGASTSLVQTVQPIQNQMPQLDIVASALTGIAPVAINFTANAVDSDGVVSGISWSYSDGGSDSGASVSHTFSSAGTYAVTATATDNFGATTTKSLSVTVNAPLIKIPPTAFFKVYEFDTWVELHSTLTKGQYDIKRAYYTIDGASTVDVTEFYPNTINWIELKTFGQHEIKLTVVDIYGQQSTFTQQVNQVEDLDTLAPYVDFGIQQSAARTVFLNFNRSFDYDIDQGIGSFHVDYGNGESEDTTNLYLTHTYSAAGAYTITVTAYTIHGTQNTVSKQFSVSDSAPATILPPIVNFGYRIYDFAQNVSFYNDKSGTPNGTILSYVWEFGDGQTATGQKVAHFYDPGSYFVTLTIVDSSGQSSSQTQHITIFGTGSNLVTQLGCDIAKPYFDFVQTCQIFALDKQNQITRVRVNWGDGTANNLTLPSVNGIFRPTHKYTSAGTYTVTETVTTSRGEIKTATTTLALTKYNPIVANIQCYTNNLLVSCNALGSYDMTGQSLTYTFNYGDSYTETNTSGVSSHAYSTAGLETVNVTVTNASGNTAKTQTQVMPVLPPNQLPIAILNCVSSAPYILKCNANGSFDNDGTIVSYKFDWNDNASDANADGSEVIHAFQNGGIHQVALTVTDNDGGVNSVTVPFDVQINKPPVAQVYCSTSGPQAVHCDSNSYDSDPGDSITEYKWDLGDGTIITSMIPSIDYTYSTSSTYTVSLQVKDTMGATSSILQSVTTIENQPPVANINCQNSGLQTISCNSFSYDPDGSIASTHWGFDDGFTFDGTMFTHTFASDSAHSATITVTDNLGKSSTATQALNVLVNQLPTFDIGVDNMSGSLPLAAHFQALNAVDPDGTIVSYKWIFGDGTTSDQPVVDHTFTIAGVYNVKLQVTDNDSGMMEKSVIIRAANPSNVIIATDKDNGVANFSVHFDASGSNSPDGVITKYEWFLNGIKLAEGPTLDYNFDEAGTQKISVTVADSFGLSYTGYKDITVIQPPIYLSGSYSNDAFVGLQYNEQFQLLLDSSIQSGNVQVYLQGAPQGVSFDSTSFALNWIPTADQAGDYQFKIIATDGVLESERNIKISVYSPNVIGGMSVGTTGGTYTINDPNNSLNGTTIEFPVEANNYNINIYQATTGNDSSVLHFESTAELSNPVRIQFPTDMAIGTSKNNVTSNLASDVETSDNSERTKSDVEACSNADISVRKEKAFDEKDFTKYQESDKMTEGTHYTYYIQNKFYNESEKETLDRIKNFIANDFYYYFDLLINDPAFKNYNIYFKDDDFLRAGWTSITMPNDIIINPKSFVGYDDIGMLYTLLHEQYHIRQHKIIGCTKKTIDSLKNRSFKFLVEGSAEINAYRWLANKGGTKPYPTLIPDRKLSDEEYAIVKRNRDPITNTNIPFPSYFKNYLENGIFTGDVYSTRIFFDLYWINSLKYQKYEALELNSLDILNYYISNLDKYNATDSDLGKKIILNYSLDKNFDLPGLLQAMTDDYSNYRTGQTYGEWYTIDTVSKDPTLYTWDKKDNSKYPDTLPMSELFNLGSFTGQSKSYALFPLDNNLNMYAYSLITINDITPKVDIDAYVDRYNIDHLFNSTAASSEVFKFQTSDMIQYVYGGLSGVTNQFDEYLRLNIVNTDLVSNEVKYSIQPLCNSISVPTNFHTNKLDVTIRGSCQGSCQGDMPLIILCSGSTRSSGCSTISNDPNAAPGTIKIVTNAGYFSNIVVCQTQIDNRGIVNYGINVKQFVLTDLKY